LKNIHAALAQLAERIHGEVTLDVAHLDRNIMMNPE